jgi:hypothetical protein
VCTKAGFYIYVFAKAGLGIGQALYDTLSAMCRTCDQTGLTLAAAGSTLSTHAVVTKAQAVLVLCVLCCDAARAVY